MAALQCEICGGKLVGKPGGVFECDSCGMEYSTEWAKAKIQEIKGTVKVEGTVEVTGKVQVEGGTVQLEGTANKKSLLKRGQLALEDGKWREADGYFDKVLDIDPECAEAYLGKLLAELRVKKQADLAKCSKPFDGRDNYEKMIRFGDAALIGAVKAANAGIPARVALERHITKEKAAEERRVAKEKAAEERRIAEEKAAKEREKIRKQRIADLDAEKASLQTELGSLKGLFSGKRRKEIEERLAQIDAKLRRLK